MKEFNEEYLKERFNRFLEKQGIDKSSMSEEALYIFERGYRFCLITSPEGEVEA